MPWSSPRLIGSIGRSDCKLKTEPNRLEFTIDGSFPRHRNDRSHIYRPVRRHSALAAEFADGQIVVADRLDLLRQKPKLDFLVQNSDFSGIRAYFASFWLRRARRWL
jgi:hypothetical protein